jgi:hypothetical protein
MDAVPLELRATVDDPGSAELVDELMKVTVPVGVAPPVMEITVAVNVTRAEGL